VAIVGHTETSLETPTIYIGIRNGSAILERQISEAERLKIWKSFAAHSI
jgi:hypothetical protein